MKISDFFSKDYIATFNDVLNEALEKEVAFIEKHIPKKAKILDVASGHGRHSIELAKRDHQVTGVELNEEAIAIAKNQKEELQLGNVVFIQEDILTFFPTQKKYDAVIFMCNIIGLIKGADETLLKHAKESLTENGKVILSISNRDELTRLSPKVWFETNGVRYLTSRRFNVETSELLMEDIRYAFGQENKYALTLRVYSYHEIHDLLKRAGFSDIQIYSDYTDEKGHVKSDEFTIVAG